MSLNYILSTKKNTRSRKDNEEKKRCWYSSKVLTVPRLLWFPLILRMMYSESKQLLPSGVRAPNRQANPAGSELVATTTASCSGTAMDIKAGSKLKSKQKGPGRLMQLCPHGHEHLNHLELPWALHLSGKETLDEKAITGNQAEPCWNRHEETKWQITPSVCWKSQWNARELNPEATQN